MKFRTDFVTNSSSSGFVALHKPESETLEKLAAEVGIDTETYDKMFGFYNNCTNEVSFDVKPDAAETLSGIMKDIAAKNNIGENVKPHISALADKIIENRDAVNSDITFTAEKTISDSEEDEIVKNTLSLEHGKGIFSAASYGGNAFLEINSSGNDIAALGETSVIENGKIISTEPSCKDDFIFIGKYLVEYRGSASVEELVIPFRGKELIFDDDVFADLDKKALKSVVIPEGVESFDDSGQLSKFGFTYVLPASLTDIEINCNKKKVTISAPAGSFAEEYAKKKGFTLA